MYTTITSTIRSKLSKRGTPLLFLPNASSTTLAQLVHPHYAHQAKLSLSMFATAGSATLNGGGSGNGGAGAPPNEQRRPFWATRPTEEETSKGVTMVNTIDHSLNAAAAAAGIPMEDIKNAKTTTTTKKEKAPKKAAAAATEPKTKKTTTAAASKTTTNKAAATKAADNEEDDDESSEMMSNVDVITTASITKVMAAKHGFSVAQAKRIVDDVFDMVIDGIVEKKQVRIARLGIFSKSLQKEKTMISIQTKEKYTVPSKYRTGFKISSTLRKVVNEIAVPPPE